MQNVAANYPRDPVDVGIGNKRLLADSLKDRLFRLDFR
jgi:hypothetical protein